MKSFEKIALDDFFVELSDEKYVIVKFPGTFPDYLSGSDVDLYCLDMKATVNKLLSVSNRYVEHGYRVVVSTKEDGGVYIDFFAPENERIDFRFDLHQSLPNFERVHVRPAYFFSILENSISIQRDAQSGKYDLYLPSKLDDLVLRYIEYIEWYERRPDKIKHLDYILEKIGNDPDLKKFLDKLHLYTKPKLLDVPPDTHFGRSILAEYNEKNKETRKEVADLRQMIENFNRHLDEINRNIEVMRAFFLDSKPYTVGKFILTPFILVKRAIRKMGKIILG
ncbi:hypothetical protein JW899_01935 [Candidatus Uhrbacteria bacterium]|nr:hypothetical protein [Candidatus Uhrbacteria bacterium]